MLDELIDRFGEPPRPVQNLLLVSQLREEAHSLYLTEIREKADSIQFTLFERGEAESGQNPGSDAVYAAEASVHGG